MVTLQVIEHVWNHPEFVRECRRVLRPGGRLLVTTPNRLTFSPGLDEPLNPFHTKEFTAAELVALLDRLRPAGRRSPAACTPGERLRALDAAHGGSLVDAQLAEPPERWSDRLRDDVASIGTADFRVLADGERAVDESLDLVTLATRPRA